MQTIMKEIGENQEVLTARPKLLPKYEIKRNVIIPIFPILIHPVHGWIVVQFNAYYDSGTRDYYKTKYSTVSGIATSLDLVHYKDQYGGARLYANFKFGPSNTMTIGLDGYFFMLDNPSDVIDYYYATQGTVAGYENAGQKNRGVFFQRRIGHHKPAARYCGAAL